MNRYYRLLIRITIGIIFFLLQSSFSSCTGNRKKLSAFENNKVKAEHFISNEQKDSSIFYSEEVKLDSTLIYKGKNKHVKYFHDNGTIAIEGTFIDDDIPVGEWRYYDEKENLTEVQELLIIKNHPFLNQNWTLDLKRDTIKEESNYFEMVMEKDTIYLNEPIKAKVDLAAPFFKDRNSSIMVILTKDYSIDFNEDFSNLNEVKLDTTFNLNIEKEMRKALGLETDFRRTSIFGKYFNDVGPQKLRGIIVEYYYTENTIPDSLGNNYYEKMQ